MKTLPKDGVIREAGQYDIPMSVYHTQCCAGPSISSSGLRKIFLESPADFWCMSDLNDDRLEQPDNENFIFGRAAHALLLGDEDFDKNFMVIDHKAPPKPTKTQISARLQGRVTDAAQDRFSFWDAMEANHGHKDFLKEEDLEHIKHIAEALHNHPFVSVLFEGQAEQSLIWQDKKTGVWLKSRLDVLAATGDFGDLKTTSQKTKSLIMRDIRLHGYDMQQGLSTIAVEEVLGVDFTAESYESRGAFNLFVYKKPPYHIIPIELDFEALHFARLKCRTAIDKFAECMKSGEWPGPVEGIPKYTIAYERDKLLAMQDESTLATSFY